VLSGFGAAGSYGSVFFFFYLKKRLNRFLFFSFAFPIFFKQSSATS
jgi:hypothetical protein